jgi:hypothetical protein
MNERSIYLPITGGLGNQLFELSAALSTGGDEIQILQTIGRPRTNSSGDAELFSFELPSLIEKSNEDFELGVLSTKVFGFALRRGVEPRKFENKKIIKLILKFCTDIYFSFLFRRLIRTHINEGVGYAEIGNTSNFLIGYFQSFKYAETDSLKQIDQIRICSPGVELLELQEASKIEQPLVVHIRLGDYENESSFGLPAAEYYLNAYRLICAKTKFNKIWLYSDDPEKALQKLPNEMKNNLRIVGNVDKSSASTLESMRLGNAFIIANSTFSWWAAKLAYNKEAIVVSPEPWFKGMKDPKYLIPPEWYRLKS